MSALSWGVYWVHMSQCIMAQLNKRPEKDIVSEKARDLEKFYWFLIRIGAQVFGWLMLAGGGLFALTFVSEKLRTGAVAYGGAEHVGALAALKAIGYPALVAVLGIFLVRYVRGRQAQIDSQ
ncbi:MAG: hypothetical protein AB8G16_03340 [Gammaproteobacteria bacterium]